MIHEILPVGLLQCNCSVYGDEQTREAIVVDPGDNVDRILRVLSRHELRVTAIVITHAHIDHIAGARKLKEATGAPIHVNAADYEQIAQLEWQAAWLGVPAPGPVEVDAEMNDGDRLRVGAAGIVVLHTPGHTRGSCCLWAPSDNLLIAGDTLFQGSVGRTDLPGGDPRRILISIRDKLLPLPDETRVIPGHGPQTTIGRERESNPFLRGL